jgi:small GTP-binding protein
VAHPCLQSLAEAHTDTLEPEELPEPWATFWAGKSWREIYKDEYYLQFDASPSSPGRQDDSFDDLLKLVVVGPGNAGKSTLLDRFVDGTYGGGFNNHGVKSATLGVEFVGMLVGIRGRRIKLQLWDTAGPERYLPVTTSYYRDARGILLCFDLTYSDSLEQLRSSYVPGVQRGAPPGAAVLLVGMKADQEECRQVSVAEVNELAAWVEDQLGVRPGYVECSSLTGDGVEQAMYSLARDALRSEPYLKAAAAAAAAAQFHSR